MGTGLVTVKLVTGKISAIAVEKVVIFKRTARTVQRISSEGETTPGPHLLVMERTEVGIMAEVTVGVTVGRNLQGKITVVLARRIPKTTVTAPGAPHQGCELNAMIHIPLEVPGEVVAIGALAPTTEFLTAHVAPGKVTLP